MRPHYDFGRDGTWTLRGDRYHADDGRRIRTPEDMKRAWLYWLGEA